MRGRLAQQKCRMLLSQVSTLDILSAMTAVLLLKVIHFTALFGWCASLFALPMLLALFPAQAGRVNRRRFLAATRFIYIAIASPAAVVAVLSGTALIHLTASYAPWLMLKLTLVAGMVLFHAACGKLILVLNRKPRYWSAPAHFAFALIPPVLIAGVLWFVLAQPEFG